MKNGRLFVVLGVGLGLLLAPCNGQTLGGGGRGGAPGATWTVRSWGVSFSGIAYGNGTFVTVGDKGIILTSRNGMAWAPRTSGTDSFLRSVTYGNGLFVAVGWNGTILTSPDGVTWIERDSRTNAALNGVTYGNGTFVAVGFAGFGGTVLTSPDGVNWTRQNSRTTSPLSASPTETVPLWRWGIRVSSLPPRMEWPGPRRLRGRTATSKASPTGTAPS